MNTMISITSFLVGVCLLASFSEASWKYRRGATFRNLKNPDELYVVKVRTANGIALGNALETLVVTEDEMQEEWSRNYNLGDYAYLAITILFIMVIPFLLVN